MEKRTPIDTKELERLLNAKKPIVRIIDKEFDEQIELDLQDRFFTTCYFVNCYFKYNLSIKISGEKKLFFYDTTVDFDLVIETEKQDKQTPSPELMFTNAQLDRLIIKDACFSKIDVHDSKLNNVHITNLILSEGDIGFTGCEIKEYLRIEKLQSKEGIWIDSSNINRVDLKNLTGKINIDRVKIYDYFSIRDSQCDLEWDRLIVDGDTSIRDSKTGNIIMNGCVFNHMIDWQFNPEWKSEYNSNPDKNKNQWIIDTIDIESSQFNGGMILGLDWNSKQLLSIKEISFLCTSSSKGDVFLRNLKIGTCSFDGMNKDCSFHFTDCYVTTNFEFSEFVNQGRIIISDMRWNENAILAFDRTILGPAHFSAIDFNKPKKIIFYDSDISQITYASVQWVLKIPAPFPRPTFLKKAYWKDYFYKHWLRLHWANLDEDNKEVVYYKNQREYYRQLKLSADKMQDRVQYLAFQCVEMKAQGKVIKLTKRALNLERIILFVGRSNDHGQNWWRPVWLALLATALFYIPIVIGLDPKLSLSDKIFTPAFFQRLLEWHNVFPHLLNPVHFLDKITPTPEAIHPATFWLDYLHRIIMAFLIFQTVSAFRKYTKS